MHWPKGTPTHTNAATLQECPASRQLTPTNRWATIIAGRYDLPLAPIGYGERIAAFQCLCPNERVSNASTWHPRFVQARDQDMRDYRDAKAMAHTLRAALAAKGLKVTISQSLELIAQAFGVADWNTLAAAIRRETHTSPPRPPTPETTPAQGSAELRSTLHRALSYASKRKHEFMTLEHLLLALMDDLDASGVMKACNVDLGALRKNVASYIDNDLKTLVVDDRKPRPTRAFARVVEGAVVNAQGLGRETPIGADLLVAIFDEKESPAAWMLGEQRITQQDALNFLHYGIVMHSGDAEG